MASDLHGHTLVNNAGLGVFGPFATTPWERTRDMLELDIVALTHMTHLFQPTPTYAAAKSHVLSFGIALNHELRGTGVSRTTLNPGVTATEFFDVAGQTPTLFQRASIMRSADVAQIGVNAMVAGRASVVAGRLMRN